MNFEEDTRPYKYKAICKKCGENMMVQCITTIIYGHKCGPYGVPLSTLSDEERQEGVDAIDSAIKELMEIRE